MSCSSGAGGSDLLLEGHGKSVSSIAALSDGERVVTSCYDGVLRMYSLRTGNILGEIEVRPPSTGWLMSVAALGGDIVACGSDVGLTV